MTSDRHPYTNACDYIRMADVSGDGPYPMPNLSRSQASAIRQAIARAIGMDDGQLADLLSIQFQIDRGIQQ